MNRSYKLTLFMLLEGMGAGATLMVLALVIYKNSPLWAILVAGATASAAIALARHAILKQVRRFVPEETSSSPKEGDLAQVFADYPFADLKQHLLAEGKACIEGIKEVAEGVLWGTKEADAVVDGVVILHDACRACDAVEAAGAHFPDDIPDETLIEYLEQIEEGLNGPAIDRGWSEKHLEDRGRYTQHVRLWLIQLRGET
jgi:hypothetical protein